MNNKALLEEIAKNATIIDFHIKRMNKKPDEVHEIDIELITEKLKEVYSRVLELETGKVIKEEIKVDKPEPLPIPEKEEDQSPPEIKPEEPPAEQEPIAEEKSESQPEEAVVETPQDEAVPEPKAELETEPEPEKNVHDETNNVSRPKTTADLFSGPTTIADSFQVEEDKSIAATAVPQPVQDLKMAIGINDKFLFINELFKGSPTDYNEAINKFNTSEGMPEVESSINEYREEYEWADNSEAYHRLKKIVFSKYN